jgi:hypothetical protein
MERRGRDNKRRREGRASRVARGTESWAASESRKRGMDG